jgi:site-specific recombinase XerD
MPTKLESAVGYGTLQVLIPSWERSLRADKSPRTLRTYIDSARIFETFCRDKLGITTVDGITRDTIETWMADQREHGYKSTTRSVRYRAVQQFIRWLIEEGELQTNPMEHTKPPKLDEVPVPIVLDDDLKKLLKTCGGPSFEDRRDEAIIRVFLDCGVRLAECVGLRYSPDPKADSDVDLSQDVLVVTGKGRVTRSIPFGAKTSKALDKYLRLRPRHPQAKSSMLWLAHKGALTASGIEQMIERRCDAAGIERVHPHQFRHTAAHTWLAAGESEGDAMRLFGWKSRTMLDRYGKSAADERARAAHRRAALGDRV